MSNKIWHDRRFGRDLVRAMDTIGRNPNAVVRFRRHGLVAISKDRYDDLVQGLEMLGKRLDGER